VSAANKWFILWLRVNHLILFQAFEVSDGLLSYECGGGNYWDHV
jgi:hypothetical protein